MTSNRFKLWCCLAAGVVALAGCRSSRLGSLYTASRGSTPANELFPGRAEAPAATPRAGAASVVDFDPPPLGGNQPAGGANGPQPSGAFASDPLPGAGHARSEPLPNPTRQEALSAIRGDLERLRDENPAAEAELLRQLHAAEPRHWQALVRRFKSTLQYNQLLAGKGDASLQQTGLATHDHDHGQGHNHGDHGHGAHDHGAGEPGFVLPVSNEAPRSIAARTVSATGGRLAPAGRASRTGVRAQALPPAPHPVTEPPHAASTNAPVSATPQPDASAAEPEKPIILPATATAPIEPRDWQDLVGDAIKKLEAEIPDDPASTSEAYQVARLRLLQLASSDLEGAVSPIPGLPPTEQEFWSNQMLAVATMLDQPTHPESKRRAAAARTHLERAYEQLKQLGTLTVRNVTFCDTVTAYGAYRERSSRSFKPGEKVILYLEVENFRTKETPDGHHRAVIGSSYEVLDSHDGRVEGGELPLLEDDCLSRRRDYFIKFIITLPERIYAGKYKLALTLTDQLGDKITRESIDFEIVE